MLLNTFQCDGILGNLIAQTITKCNCCRESNLSRNSLAVDGEVRLGQYNSLACLGTDLE